MFRLPAPAAWLIALLALVVLLSNCQGTLRGGDDTRDMLYGTWLREYSEDGTQVRRVLALERSGSFHESVRVVEHDGGVTQFEHAGTWLYDGTNLKRKYTLIDGKPPSRLNVPFATFEIAFPTPNEFTGVDHIHGHRIDYHRMAADIAANSASATVKHQ